ncbi:unnamed protein product [Orchesella dallaii]|uniref:Uncharacterized protein n=1 Tax=Orchesella dallaii TaxID=48710 RepID=A0ABP1Q2Q4_9HEXA
MQNFARKKSSDQHNDDKNALTKNTQGVKDVSTLPSDPRKGASNSGAWYSSQKKESEAFKRSGDGGFQSPKPPANRQKRKLAGTVGLPELSLLPSVIDLKTTPQIRIQIGNEKVHLLLDTYCFTLVYTAGYDYKIRIRFQFKFNS